MPKGERRSVQERLDAIVADRAEGLARFEKRDGVLATKERELREKLIRERVTAELSTELDARIAEELAKAENGDGAVESAEVSNDWSDVEDSQFSHA